MKTYHKGASEERQAIRRKVIRLKYRKLESANLLVEHNKVKGEL